MKRRYERENHLRPEEGRYMPYSFNTMLSYLYRKTVHQNTCEEIEDPVIFYLINRGKLNTRKALPIFIDF